MITGIQVGKRLWNSDEQAVVTEHLYESVREARPILTSLAALGRTITYTQLVERLGAYNVRRIGPLLDGISWDCEVRGEPNLVTLITNVKGEVHQEFVEYMGGEQAILIERTNLREWWGEDVLRTCGGMDH